MFMYVDSHMKSCKKYPDSCLNRGDDMVSTETIGKENLPVIRFHKQSDGQYYLSVMTIADLAQVLNIAKERKLDETRACLEGKSTYLVNTVSRVKQFRSS